MLGANAGQGRSRPVWLISVRRTVKPCLGLAPTAFNTGELAGQGSLPHLTVKRCPFVSWFILLRRRGKVTELQEKVRPCSKHMRKPPWPENLRPFSKVNAKSSAEMPLKSSSCSQDAALSANGRTIAVPLIILPPFCTAGQILQAADRAPLADGLLEHSLGCLG